MQHNHVQPVPGIYTITNKVNGKLYVGSAKDLRKRCRGHINALVANRHANPKLQRSFNKYGRENFEFKVQCVVQPELLSFYEQRFLDMLDSVNIGYNIDKVAGRTSFSGYKHSAETKAKIAAAVLKNGSCFQGRRHSLETRAKIAEANRGRKMSEKTRAAFSQNWGKTPQNQE